MPAKLAAVSKRLQTHGMLAVFVLTALNLYALWPTLGLAGKVAAGPLLLVGSYLWVRFLQLLFGLLTRVSARVA